MRECCSSWLLLYLMMCPFKLNESMLDAEIIQEFGIHIRWDGHGEYAGFHWCWEPPCLVHPFTPIAYDVSEADLVLPQPNLNVSHLTVFASLNSLRQHRVHEFAPISISKAIDVLDDLAIQGIGAAEFVLGGPASRMFFAHTASLIDITIQEVLD